MAGTYSKKPFADSVSSISVLERDGVVATVGTPSIMIKEVDLSGDVTYAVGATVPTAGDAGYATGCFFKNSAGGEGSTLYVNEGNSTSASFAAVATLGGGSIGTAALRVAHAKYDFSVDGGAIGAITPASTASIPANAIIVGGTINPTTAVTSAGSATVSVGTSAGSSATALLGATAKASLSIDALLNSTATFAAPVKMSAAGNINITVATAALTAGVIEVFVLYYVAANA
jgi:hypothetical protein